MSADKVARATQVWYGLYDSYKALQLVAVELFSNPLATNEQKLTVANMLGEIRNKLIEERTNILRHPDYRKPPFNEGIAGVKL